MASFRNLSKYSPTVGRCIANNLKDSQTRNVSRCLTCVSNQLNRTASLNDVRSVGTAAVGGGRNRLLREQRAELHLPTSLNPFKGNKRKEYSERRLLGYAFTVISNIAVYALTWLLLETDATGEMKRVLSRADAPTFRNLAFVVVGAGLVFSGVFHFGTREPRRLVAADNKNVELKSMIARSEDENEQTAPTTTRMTWTSWLKLKQFYLVAMLYMCTRLVVNVSQVYLPTYLLYALDLDKAYMAIVPLVVFVSGFVTSIFMKLVNRICGRKITYYIGLQLICGACVWFYFISLYDLERQIFGAAVLLGSGCSTILITSLSMTADLIADDTETSAFVYGAMSFTDKLSNGVAVILIQRFHPCCVASPRYHRNVMAFVPGGVALLALVVLFGLVPQKIGDRSHLANHPKSQEERERETCTTVRYTMEQMYRVAADVDSYTEFVPWCKQAYTTDHTRGRCKAHMTIGFPPLSENYIANVTTERPNLVKSICKDGRMFDLLATTWKFSPGLAHIPQTCTLDFSVAFEFRSALHSNVAHIFFDEVVRTMVNAFLKRAETIYGPSSIRKQKPRVIAYVS